MVGQVLIKALRRCRKHFTWLSCPFLWLSHLHIAHANILSKSFASFSFLFVFFLFLPLLMWASAIKIDRCGSTLIDKYKVKEKCMRLINVVALVASLASMSSMYANITLCSTGERESLYRALRWSLTFCCRH